MDYLTHNPIADIHGPAFLLVYGLVALAVIAGAYGIVRTHDKSRLREPPLVPPTFDPYELAYLRGGTNAVTHTAVYALYRRSLVTIISSKRFKWSRLIATAASDTGTLTEVEKRVFEALDQPADPSSLFHGKVAKDIETPCEPLRRKLESEELLRTADAKGTATWVLVAASSVLVALTLYKIAIAEGRPVGFLIMLTILSLIVLWSVVGSVARGRMTDRGRAYLKRLQVAYENLRQPDARATGQLPQAEHLDAPSVAMVGLFGLTVLTATPDAAVAGIFASSASSGVSSGGCGGGCGGGGGGCGGGGGGCGGGGCGG
jgi:uncharacterized protein (TIGR04222 family)